MPNTYTELRRTVVGTATSSVTLDLTGISGYTDLVLVISAFGNTGGVTDYNTWFQVNGDTANNYSRTTLIGDGSVAFSGRSSNINKGAVQLQGYYPTTEPFTAVLNFMNYANTTTFKTVLNRSSLASAAVEADVSLWRSTAAITSIRVFVDAGSFKAGSTFSLYGIAAAPVLTAKATGGTIFYGSDGYVYHRFTGSGSFVPSSNLSADCLVVAGGGGSGAGAIGGGGGAGGFRVLSSQSLTNAVTYSVTVGGGGTAGSWSGSGSVAGSGSNSIISGTGLTTITSNGGGGGSGGDATFNAASGGSGGGANYVGGTGGSGNTPSTSPSQGTSGTNGYLGNFGGGGGGALVAATDKNGGNGSSDYSIWGSATSSGQYVSGNYWYAGGGGGGSRSGNTGGSGGNGGGGAGSTGQGSGTAGTANTGGGAGGAGYTSNNVIGGSAGGSGIVIIRYPG